VPASIAAVLAGDVIVAISGNRTQIKPIESLLS